MRFPKDPSYHFFSQLILFLNLNLTTLNTCNDVFLSILISGLTSSLVSGLVSFLISGLVSFLTTGLISLSVTCLIYFF